MFNMSIFNALRLDLNGAGNVKYPFIWSRRKLHLRYFIIYLW